MATNERGALSRFSDYFVICGLDPNSGLEVLSTYEIDGTSKQNKNTLYLSFFVIFRFCLFIYFKN